MPHQTDVNGDPRYTVSDTEYYTLLSTFEADSLPVPVYGVEDSEEGYIAFTTSLEHANRIAAALDAAA